MLIELALLATCVVAVVALSLPIARSGGAMAPPVLAIASLAIVGSAASEVVGPGPPIALVLAGAVAVFLYTVAPRITAMSVVGTATIVVIWQGVWSGICEPPLRGFALLAFLSVGLGVPYLIRRQSAPEVSLFDPRMLVAIYAALTFAAFLLTRVGALVVDYRPSPAWLVVVLFVPAAFWIRTRNPAADLVPLAVATIAIFLVGSRAALAARTGICSTMASAALVTTGSTLTVAALLAMSSRRWTQIPSPFVR